MSLSTLRASHCSTRVSWRLHVGAHKTGTTHLQSALAMSMPAISAAGIRYVPLAELRPSLSRHYPRRGLSRIVGNLRRRSGTAATLATLRGEAASIIVSEENLLGAPADIFARSIYPDLRRLAPFRAFGAQVGLFLAIRSFEQLLPSAFFEMLKLDANAEMHFLEARRRMTANPPRWTSLVERLRQTLPDASITIWLQEDYALDPSPALRALTGIQDLTVSDIPRPKRTLSPAKSALEDVAALPSGMLTGDRRNAVLDIYARHPADRSSPVLLDAAEADAARKAYAEDVAEIAADGRVTFLARPEPDPISETDP